jgi:hypothetical protein
MPRPFYVSAKEMCSPQAGFSCNRLPVTSSYLRLWFSGNVPRAEGEIWIASTSLAAALGGAAASDVQQVTEGFIVVETNYRVGELLISQNLLTCTQG